MKAHRMLFILISRMRFIVLFISNCIKRHSLDLIDCYYHGFVFFCLTGLSQYMSVLSLSMLPMFGTLICQNI